MRTRGLGLLQFLLLLACGNAYAQNQYNLSHVANGSFGQGVFRTTFILFNNNDAGANAVLSITDDTGNPLTVNIPGLGTGNRFAIALDGGASRILQTDGSGSLAVGAAAVTSASNIGVSAIFTIYDSNGNFQTEAGVGVSSPATEFVIPVDASGAFNTGLALFNSGAGSASVTMILLNTSGTEFGRTTLPTPLAAGQHIARFVAGPGQLFPSTPANFRGTLVVQSTTPISALTLRQNSSQASPTYTSLPVVARNAAQTSMDFPQVANGAYGNISFRTSFLLFNISQSPATASLTLTQDNGSPFVVNLNGLGSSPQTNSTFSIPLNPGASVFLQTDGAGAGTAGSAVLTSNVPVGASTIFTVFGSQGQFLTEAGVGDSRPMNSLTVPVDVSDTFNTGVAFFNPGTSPQSITAKLLDQSGGILDTATVSLPAKNHVARFVSGAGQLFPSISSFQGTLAVSAPGGVAALTLRQYAGAANPTYTTLPVASGTATGRSAQSVYSVPMVADGTVAGGKRKTTLMLVNPGQTTVQVQLSLTKDDGSPLRISFPRLGAGNQFSFSINPGGTQILQSDGSGDGSSGAARIAASAPLRVSHTLSSFDASGNAVGSSSVAAPTPDLEFLIPVDSTSGVTTGVALFNPGPSDASVTCKFLDAQGTILKSAQLAVAANRKVTRFAAGDLFPDLGNTRGTLDVISSTPVAATAIRAYPASAVMTLLPAARRVSQQLSYYLPATADGTAPGRAVKTTFLLANTGSQAATVTLALSLDDGSPMSVSIPGPGSGSTFKTTLAPGAAAFWQTDGAGSYQTGAAVVTSDGPIGVGAVAGAYDGQGNLAAEAGLPDSALKSRFRVVFDTAGGSAPPAVLLLNPGSAALNARLTLLDAAGKPAGSAQIPSLAPGARLQGKLSDYFPTSTVQAGSVDIDSGGPVGGSLAALAISPNSGVLPISAAPAAEETWIGQALNVQTTLDATRKKSVDIGRAGGNLQLTDAAGNSFSLTIPPNALAGVQSITMTPVSSAAGLPGNKFAAGVQLEPDGLILNVPATLAIQTKSAVPADSAVPIGWHGSGHGLYLNFVLPDVDTMTLSLSHFSGAGVGQMSSDDLTAALMGIGNQIDLENSLIAHWILMAHYAIQHRQDPAPMFAKANAEFLNMFNTAIRPLLDLGLESQDLDVLRCAMENARAYLARGAALGLFGKGNAAADAIRAAVQSAIDRANTLYENKVKQVCGDTRDFLTGMELLLLAQKETAAGHADVAQDLVNTALKCPPTLEMDFSSEIQGTVTDIASGTFTGKISARVPVTGGLTKEALTTIQDPTKDLFTSFLFSGSARETYDLASATSSTGCAVTFPSLAPDTFKVNPQQGQQLSRIVYTFILNFDPTPLLRNGEQLSEFCPICQKKALDVEMLIDAGKPSETVTVTCLGHPFTLPPANMWWSLWVLQHLAPGTDLSFITGWDLFPDGVPLASKTITKTIPGPPGSDGTEKTTFTLINPPLQTVTKQ
jgi:hypothetical protein